jgi:hypothetical protein
VESDEFVHRALIAAAVAYADGFDRTAEALIEIAFQIISEESARAKSPVGPPPQIELEIGKSIK